MPVLFDMFSSLSDDEEVNCYFSSKVHEQRYSCMKRTDLARDFLFENHSRQQDICINQSRFHGIGRLLKARSDHRTSAVNRRRWL